MSQTWEPPGQPSHPEDQQPTADPPNATGGATTAYPPLQVDPYGPPVYPRQPPAPAYAYPQPHQQAYQPYATPPAAPVSGTTTVVAGVVQIVQSAFWLVVGVLLVALSGDTSAFWDDSDFDENFTPSDGQAVILVVGFLFALLAASTLTLAILTLRRINGCRIASAVMQTLFGAVGVLVLLAAVGDGDPGGLVAALLLVGSCATAATLLYGGPSARYCRARKPGGQQGGQQAVPRF